MISESVGIRELLRNTSGVIDRAGVTGAEIIITRNGRPVAALRALTSQPSSENMAGLLADLPDDHP